MTPKAPKAGRRILLAGLFAAVVMLAMRPRLAAIDMVESLKSVD